MMWKPKGKKEQINYCYNFKDHVIGKRGRKKKGGKKKKPIGWHRGEKGEGETKVNFLLSHSFKDRFKKKKKKKKKKRKKK